MVQRRATFLSPSGCGCKVAMDGTWMENDLIHRSNGTVESMRHPVVVVKQNGFVEDVNGDVAPQITRQYPSGLAIVAVCAEHAPVLLAPVEADPYRGAEGYIPVPETPTDAEKLYIHLYRYTAQLSQSTCDCKYCEWSLRPGYVPNEERVFEYVKHAREHKCDRHQGLPMGKALRDVIVKENSMVAEARRALGELADSVVFEFDGTDFDRRLMVVVETGATKAAVDAVIGGRASVVVRRGEQP